MLSMNYRIGDTVCFGDGLGNFGKIPHKVIGVEQREDGLYIKTDYNDDYAPVQRKKNINK